MAASVEEPSPGLESDVEHDGYGKGHSSENTSFRYLTFDEWQTGEVTQDGYATVERPRWLNEFYAKCAQHHRRPVIQNPPLRYRTPMFIIDQRFAVRKPDKVFICDNCQLVVPYSSVKRGTGSRACFDFAGSYLDHSWDSNIPGECLKVAWEHGLIDCTWHCSLVCRGPVTGAGKDRQSRPAAWRAGFTRQ